MSKVTTTPQAELAQWIDDTVIAQVILEELEEEGVSATLENGQEVWLRMLEELHHLANSSIIGLIFRGKLQP